MATINTSRIENNTAVDGLLTDDIIDTFPVVVHYFLVALGIIITIATILGNVLVIIAVVKEKKLRKVGNVFIINLAFSDCLVGTLVNPLAILYDMTGRWILGDILCDFWVSMDVICCTASIVNLCAIASDRCNAIVQPIKYSRKRTFRRAWLIVLCVWLYSIGIAIPPFLGWNNNGRTSLVDGACQITTGIGYTLYSTIAAFYLPLVIMMYFYYNIFKATCIRKGQWRRSPGSRHFVGPDSETANSSNQRSLSPSWACMCMLCTSRTKELPRELEHSPADIVEETLVRKESIKEISPVEPEHDSRQSTTDPDMLEIYQMRQQSARQSSAATLASFGSFLSSSESSNTATTSVSDSSGRSYDSSGRSYSTSTQSSGRSMSTSTDSGRRYSVLKAYRLSRRQSSLQTEVIHELVTQAAQAANETTVQEPEETVAAVSTITDARDTDYGLDEESDEPTGKVKTKIRKLKSSTLRSRNSRKRRRIALSQEKRAAKTLGVVIGCFIVCWLPFFLVTLIKGICLSCYIHPILYKTVLWLGYFNSACNPVIYTFFNKDFRHAFRKLTCSSSNGVIYV